MLFHSMIQTLMELGELTRQRQESRSGTPRRHLESMDVLDVNYEDVLEYYRYSNTNAQANDQESSESN